MNILFVTLSSIETNTSAMLRNKALIKGLIQSGAKIDLLTIPALKIHPFYDDSTNILDGKNKNINVILLNQNSMYSSMVESNDNFLGKIKKKLLPSMRYIYHSLSLFDNTIYLARKINKSVLQNKYYDFIISSSDPKSSHVATHQLIKAGIKYGKWIQYWGDPLTIDITKKSIYPKFYVRKIEKRIFSCVDKIVYVSPLTLEEQIHLFPDYSNRMTFIPIPYIQEKHYPHLEKRSNEINIGYFGDYDSSIRDISPLYNLCKNNDIKLIIAGNSNLRLKNTNNIQVLPRIAVKQIEKLEAQCDILVCILNKYGTQIPGKLYHYAATNKPIIVILDGDKKEVIRNYLKKFNRYVLCENSEESIKNAIVNIRLSNQEYKPSPFFKPEAIANQVINFNE